jgi:hypothetical protein
MVCTLTAYMCIAQPQAKQSLLVASYLPSKMGGGKNKKKKGAGGGGGGGGAQKSGGGGKKQKAAAEPVPPVEDEFDPMNPPEADEDDDAYDDGGGDGVEGVSGKLNELAVSGSDDLSAQASATSVDTSGILNYSRNSMSVSKS